VIKRLGLLIGGSLLFAGIAAVPAYWLAGEPGVVFGAVALALCLVPALVTMLLAEWSFRRSPDTFLLAVLGGTSLRMFVVLGAVWVIYQNHPYFQEMGFIVAVMVAYFFTLTLEMVVLLAGRVGMEKPGSATRR
jgi:hypothetical protein